MRFSQLTNDEKTATGGFTHRLDFSYKDIPAGIATNTILTLSAAPLPKLPNPTIIKQCEVHLTVPFQNTADAAFNSDTISLGLVTGGVAALVAAFEANANGTFIVDTIPGVATPAVPVKNVTAANQVTITVNSMAAKTISNLNAGYLYALFSFQLTADQSTVKNNQILGTGYV